MNRARVIRKEGGKWRTSARVAGAGAGPARLPPAGDIDPTAVGAPGPGATRAPSSAAAAIADAAPLSQAEGSPAARERRALARKGAGHDAELPPADVKSCLRLSPRWPQRAGPSSPARSSDLTIGRRDRGRARNAMRAAAMRT